VFEHGVQDVDAAAGKAEEGCVVAFAPRPPRRTSPSSGAKIHNPVTEGDGMTVWDNHIVIGYWIA
jgi:hypothetical protein